MKTLKFVLAWTVCATALLLVGCAPGVDGMRQAVANTAVTVAAGYRTLGTIDEQVQARIRVQLKSDPKAASIALDEHLARRDIARKALDAGAALVETANAAIPLVERGIAKDKSAGAWIADLVSVGLTVAAALQKMGVI